MKISKALKNVIVKMEEREAIGLVKYGTTVDRKDLTFDEWLTHLQEELMDAVLYIEAVKNDKEE